MAYIDQQTVDHLRKLQGRPSVTYPYGLTDYPKVEQVSNQPKTRWKLNPLSTCPLAGYTALFLTEQHKTGEDDQYVEVYRCWEVLPGPYLKSFKIHEHTGDVWLIKRCKRKITDFTGSPPVVQVGVTTGATTTVTSSPATPKISSSRTIFGFAGLGISYTITATNSPTSFAATGLPAGFSINTTTGHISGDPVTSPIILAPITLSATNSAGTTTVDATLTFLPGASAIPPAWEATTAYTVGDLVVPPGSPPTGGWPAMYICTHAGTSGTTVPKFTFAGNSIVDHDGEVTNGFQWYYAPNPVSGSGPAALFSLYNWQPSHTYAAGDYIIPPVVDPVFPDMLWRATFPGTSGTTGVLFTQVAIGTIYEQSFTDYATWVCLTHAPVPADSTPIITTTFFDGLTVIEREDIDAVIAWEVVTQIPKSKFYSRETALISYEDRAEEYPAYAQLISGFDGTTVYQKMYRKAVRAQIVKRRESTWWVIAASSPDIAINEIITDTMLIDGQEMNGVLHDSIVNGSLVPTDPAQIQPIYSFVGVPANYAATKPSKSEYVSSWIGTWRVREFEAVPEMHGMFFRCTLRESFMR